MNNLWCLYKPCKYTSPVIVKINYPFKDGYMVTEYGFGESSKFINTKNIICCGDKSELTNRLKIWLEMERDIELCVNKMSNNDVILGETQCLTDM